MDPEEPQPEDPEEENPTAAFETEPLPRRLFSDETGEPFRQCIECARPLLVPGRPYLVQKCSNGRETVLEFAICTRCAGQLHQSYSEASRAAITRFFEERVDPVARIARLREAGDPDLERWLAECLTCRGRPEPGQGFALVALCAGEDLLYGHSPFLVCSACEMELNENISAETRGEWDRFVGRNFDLPPSEFLTPDRTPKLVIV